MYGSPIELEDSDRSLLFGLKDDRNADESEYDTKKPSGMLFYVHTFIS